MRERLRRILEITCLSVFASQPGGFLLDKSSPGFAQAMRKVSCTASSASERSSKRVQRIVIQRIEHGPVQGLYGVALLMVEHLPAIAHECGIDLDLSVANEISKKTPNLCHLAPAGNHYIEELDEAGGIRAVMNEVSKLGVLHLDCLTVTGKTVGENIAGAKILDPEIIHTVENPIAKEGGIAVLKGNLAPEGSVVKRAAVAPEMMTHSGKARVFDCEEDALNAIYGGQINAGEVVVIRYEGPKGGPGMREMLNPTSAIMGSGLGHCVALITDGRFSGHPGAMHRSRFSGSRRGRSDRSDQRRRHHHDRHSEQRDQR